MKTHKICWIKQNKDWITNNKAKSKTDQYSLKFFVPCSANNKILSDNHSEEQNLN